MSLPADMLHELTRDLVVPQLKRLLRPGLLS